MDSGDAGVFKDSVIYHKLLGVWPEDNPNLNRFNQILAYFYTFLAISATCLQYSGLLEVTDFFDASQCIIEGTASLISVIKIMPHACNRNNAVELIKMTIKISEYSKVSTEEREISTRWQSYQDKLIKLFSLSYSAVMILLYICAPLYADKDFPFHGILPEILLLTPWYQITYAIESIMLLLILIGDIACDCFCITVFCQLCCELELVRLAVRNIGINNKTCLPHTIQRHAIVLDYGERICNNLATKFLFQHLLISVFLCFGGIITLSTQSMINCFKTIVMSIIVTLTLLVICFVGETITNASLDIADAIWKSNYENFLDDIPMLRSVNFILCRAQKPLVMTVGCNGSMNLRFFSETMNKVVSFFLILKTFME